MLALLVTLAVAASSVLLVARTVRIVRALPRPKRLGNADHDLWKIAFLSGGPARVADAAIAGMHQDGRLAVGGPGVVTVRQPVAYDPVETAVLDSLARTPDGSLGTLRRHVMHAPAVQAVGDGLAARGLMRHPRTGRPWRLYAAWQAGICAAGLALVLLFTLTGAITHAQSQPPFVVTILPAALAGTVVGWKCRKALGRRVTRAGAAVVKAAAAGVVTNAAQSAALLVALGSTALLVDDVLREQLTEAQRSAAAASAYSPSPVGTSGGSSGSPGSGCGWNVPDGNPDTSWCGSSCGGGTGSGCGSSSGGSGGGDSGSSSGGSSCGSSSSCGGGGCGGS
ncbi:TIGR04222 domain-containing membrane protein [Streptomyces sp. NPDC017529]|uniref:TIGR04222 domain-containing membrane protein n=1 Tax=Streptomyces sp. NPDC017529 TaxID=3365000 RepID=UPI0037B48818